MKVLQARPADYLSLSFGNKCMFKKALYFFTTDDEEEVSEALLKTFPCLKFVDGQRWQTAEPPLVTGIHKCKSGIAYLWPSDLVPQLPFIELPKARQYGKIRFQGPTAGPVIQFCRCLKKPGVIEFGQADASTNDAKCPIWKSHAKVIAFLKKTYRCGLDCYSSRTGELLSQGIRDYLVGRSIQDRPAKAPRLVLAIGRDEYLVPSAKSAEPPYYGHSD
jgi:hypothetical protein